MKITGNITFTYKNSHDAESVFKSLEADNEDFLESELCENKIRYNISSEKLGSFLTTADDLISSEIVSENIIKTTKK